MNEKPIVFNSESHAYAFIREQLKALDISPLDFIYLVLEGRIKIKRYSNDRH